MGAVFGGIIELIVIRRLFRSPRVIVLVATVGIAQLCQVIPFTYPDINATGVVRYPVVTSASWRPFEGIGMSEPQLWTVLAAPVVIAAVGWALLALRSPQSRSGQRTMWLSVWLAGLAVTAGIVVLIAGGGEPKGLRIAGSQLTILVVVPLIALGLYLVLNRTWFGKNVAAAAENADLSRLAGVNPKMVSTFVWVLAGLISTVAIVLLSGQSGGVSVISGLGPLTLARAMVAAAIAGMTSFPRAMAAGIYLGVIEFTVKFNLLEHPGLFDFLLLIAVLVAVAMQRGQRLTAESFSFTPKVPPIPSHLRQIWWIRHMNRLALGAGLLALILVPLIITQPSRQLAYASVLAFALCAKLAHRRHRVVGSSLVGPDELCRDRRAVGRRPGPGPGDGFLVHRFQRRGHPVCSGHIHRTYRDGLGRDGGGSRRSSGTGAHAGGYHAGAGYRLD